MTAWRAKILREVRLTEYPVGLLSGGVGLVEVERLEGVLAERGPRVVGYRA